MSRENYHIWSDADVAALRLAYTAGGGRQEVAARKRELAARIGVAIGSLYFKAKALGLASDVTRRWTPRQDAILRKLHAAGRSDGAIAAAVGGGMDFRRVCFRRKVLGLKTTRPLPPRAERYSAQAKSLHAAGHTDFEIAGVVGCHPRTVARCRRLLGLAPMHPCGSPQFVWTASADATLRRLHGDGYSDAEIGKRLGTSKAIARLRRDVIGLPPQDGAAGSPFRRRLADALKGRLSDIFKALLGDEPPTGTMAEFARRYCLPDDLKPRQVQIVLLLLDGPTTLCSLAGRMGLTVTRSNPRGAAVDYVADLIRRGLVCRTPRGSGAQLLLLSIVALEMLASAQRQGGGR